jgi:L-2-hydroxyglutarate oxidase LhgO
VSDAAEAVVIGAGVIGLAVAAELSKHGQVLVLDRHRSFGRETSSHNSGVVHAGIYYPPDWLKTRLCRDGNALLYQWAERWRVPVRRTGKLIIATDNRQLPALDELYAAALSNGVPGMRRLSLPEAVELEPSVRLAAAIFSETSGVIDQAELMRSFEAAAREGGVLFAYMHTVVDIDRKTNGYLLRVSGPDGLESEVAASLLVNCAGTGADLVAAMLGYPIDGTSRVPRLRQRLVKGRYYDIVNPSKASRIKHLVYPLPHADRAGLGVHVTLDIDGGVHLGPDAEWLEQDAPLDYRADDLRRDEFVAAAREYLPWLTSEDVSPGQVGYRTKLHDPGEGPADFLIWRDGGYVHLGGMESPGMTASLAIARYVAALL